jgi:hydrogenase maturation protease
MDRTLIIGCGNPLRGDDSLGWRAAERLAAALPETGAEIVTCHQLTPELAEPISRATLVIFIDASRQGKAGTLFCQSISPEVSLPSVLSHHLTPRMLLGWSHDIFGACPEAIVFSVSGGSFDCGEELSSPVASVLPELIERICALAAARKSCSAGNAGPQG